MSSQIAIDFQGAVPAFCAALVKFAGGKGWLTEILVPRLHAHLANVSGTYVEPFAGSLAVGLALGWGDAVYGDTCEDLANLYASVAAEPDRVADEIAAISVESGESAYYRIRESVWPENRGRFLAPALAARTVWLNKNSYNGLFRYALRSGRFNVPWGKRENVVLPSCEHVHRVSAAIRGATIRCADFGSTLALVASLRAKDPERLVVYLDPPYGAKLKDVSTRGARDRGGKSAGVFTGYTGRFTWADQVWLAKWARSLAEAGALVVASNSWTDEVCDLYRDGFSLFQVGVRHCIGATADRRGKRAELLAVSDRYAGVLESVPANVRRRK